jgi:hypothetical protein
VNVNACLAAGDPEGTSHVVVTFANDGRVTGTTVERPYAGTKTGICVAEKFRSVRARAFTHGGPVTVSKAFSVPR